MIINSLFRKQTKMSTNNFKIDINGISDPLEMCKNIISAESLFINQLEICCRKTGNRSITQVLP